MVAWAETMVRGAPPAGLAAALAPPRQAQQQQLRMGVDGAGRLVAGVAGFDAAQRLFATEEAARALLRRGALYAQEGMQLELTTRLKNFAGLPPEGRG